MKILVSKMDKLGLLKFVIIYYPRTKFYRMNLPHLLPRPLKESESNI